jgi:hypothetical protein
MALTTIQRTAHAIHNWANTRDLDTQGRWADLPNPYSVIIREWSEYSGVQIPESDKGMIEIELDVLFVGDLD